MLKKMKTIKNILLRVCFAAGLMLVASGAFGTTLRVNRLTFDAKFTGVGGFSIVNANKLASAHRDYITGEDLESGDFFRLENLSASYCIPFNAKWIKNFKVSLAAHNLFTVTKYSGYNPDVNCYGLFARTNGVDYGSFPFCRSIVLGVSVNF